MRCITLWRTKESPINWDFCVSESVQEAGEVIVNLQRQKITKATTYELGEAIGGLCINADIN